MLPFFRHVDRSGNQTDGILNPVAYSPENTQSMQLMFGVAHPYPLSFRFFGYDRYPPGKTINRAGRPYIIRYMVGGRGTFNGEPISRGCCYMSTPGVRFCIISDEDDPIEHYWFDLYGAKASIYAERVFGSLNPGIIQLNNMDAYEALFANLLFGDSRGRNTATYCYGFFFQLLSMHQSEQPQKDFISKSSAMYNDAVAYIDAHINRQIKVSDLCAHLHIVPNYLYKLFMRYGGVSPQTHIIVSKMQTAATLLLQHDDSIAAIGDMVGYPDQGQFSRCFRRVYGMPPSDYRRRAREQNGRSGRIQM